MDHKEKSANVDKVFTAGDKDVGYFSSKEKRESIMSELTAELNESPGGAKDATASKTAKQMQSRETESKYHEEKEQESESPNTNEPTPKHIPDEIEKKRKEDLKEAAKLELGKSDKLHKEDETKPYSKYKQTAKIEKWDEIADNLKIMNEAIGRKRLDGLVKHLKNLTLETKEEKRLTCLRDIILHATDGEMTGTIVLEITAEDANGFKEKMANMSLTETPVATSSSLISVGCLEESETRMRVDERYDSDDGNPKAAAMRNAVEIDDDNDEDDVEHITGKNRKRKPKNQLERPDLKSLKLENYDNDKILLLTGLVADHSSLDPINLAENIPKIPTATNEDVVLESSENNMDASPKLVTATTDDVVKPTEKTREMIPYADDIDIIKSLYVWNNGVDSGKDQPGTNEFVEERKKEADSVVDKAKENEHIQVGLWDTSNEGQSGDEIDLLEKAVEDNDKVDFTKSGAEVIDQAESSDKSMEMINAVESTNNIKGKNEAVDTKNKGWHEEVNKAAEKNVELAIFSKTVELNKEVESTNNVVKTIDNVEIPTEGAKKNDKAELYYEVAKNDDEVDSSDKIEAGNDFETSGDKEKMVDVCDKLNSGDNEIMVNDE